MSLSGEPINARGLEPGGTTTGRHWHRLRVPALLAIVLTLASADSFAQERPTVGVAFGGGSARGIAHVGVIRWLEEHRIPMDVAAGTSMGGLIGGAFATGMDAASSQGLLDSVNWDELFGGSTFAYKNIRRKADGRAYPSRLEFGLKGGIVPPTSINNGEYVELMLGRIAAPYHELESFDSLPTPFRTVAVDLVTARPGRDPARLVGRCDARHDVAAPDLSARDLDGQILVDGGTMNNVPADVVKGMGADKVIAINVGDLSDRESLSYTLLGVAGSTLDAMMRSTTRDLADIGRCHHQRATGQVRLAGLARRRRTGRGGLQGGRSDARTAPAARRQRGRLRRCGAPSASSGGSPRCPRRSSSAWRGSAPTTTKRLETPARAPRRRAARHPAIEADLAELTGLDRYETITWRTTHDEAGASGLCGARSPKAYAPPFMMLGFNLENTTSDDFRITATAAISRSTWAARARNCASTAAGSDPGRRRASGTGRSDAAVRGAVRRHRHVPGQLHRGRHVVARYGQHGGARRRQYRGQPRRAQRRAAGRVRRPHSTQRRDRRSATCRAGRKDTGATCTWRVDTQDSPIVPSRGTLGHATFSYVFGQPERHRGRCRVHDHAQQHRVFPQLAGEANRFWRAGERTRLFVLAPPARRSTTSPCWWISFHLARRCTLARQRG